MSMTEPSKDKKHRIPLQLLKPLEEYCDCYILFYFDTEGKPCYISHTMNPKDTLALTEFVRAFKKGNVTSDEAGKAD